MFSLVSLLLASPLSLRCKKSLFYLSRFRQAPHNLGWLTKLYSPCVVASIILLLHFQIAAQRKEFLPIDLSWFLAYILDNGSGAINLIFGTSPIIKWYRIEPAASSFLPQKKGEFLIFYLRNNQLEAGEKLTGAISGWIVSSMEAIE